MSSAEPPIQLPLTEEQQELIHRLTGEHANVLELALDPSDGGTGTGRAIRFNWRVSVDTGIPRQQWILGGAPRRPVSDSGASG
jgi:hypothetical protein